MRLGLGLGIGGGGGAAPWSPLALGSKLQLWLRGENVTASGGAISQWSDASGRGRHATQSGAGKPTETTINSKPAVAFAAASTQSLDLPNAFTALTEGTLVIVGKKTIDPPATTGGYDLGSNATGTHFPFTNGNVYDSFASTTRQTVTRSASNWASAPFLYEAISTATEWTARVNNVQRFTTATNTVGWSTTPNLGSHGGGAVFYDGIFAEVLIISPVLTAGERTSLVAYLKARWALSNVA